MRILKGIIGWLCALSITYVVVSVGVWIYVAAAPFMHGASIDWLPYYTPDDLAAAVSKRGLSVSDGVVLREYITRRARPTETVVGFDAVCRSLDTQLGRHYSYSDPEPYGYQRAAAAALMDRKGRVIAAYPRQLAGMSLAIDPVIVPGMPGGFAAASEHPASIPQNQFYDSTWSTEFERIARDYAPTAAGTMEYILRDRKGSIIGYLAVAQNGNRQVMVPPADGYTTPAWLSNLGDTLAGRDFVDLPWRALSGIILYVLLLPLWVGLDAAWRGSRPFAWGLLVALTNIIGLGAYLLARPKAPATCGNCGERVLGSYVRCPGCGVSLRARCPVCSTRMKPEWQFCPVCKGTVPPPPEPRVERPEPRAKRESSQGSAGISIRVTDPEEAPASGISISLRGPSPRDGITNAMGIFDARRLEPGEYTITAAKPGHTSGSATVDVEEGGLESVSLNIVPLPGAITGRVVDTASGKPVAGAVTYLDTSRVDRMTRTDAKGGFEITDVPAGSYTVCVEAEGFGSQTRLVEIMPGKEVTLDLLLIPINDYQLTNAGDL